MSESESRYPRKLKAAVGWPIRRILNPRFDATVHAVDYRLGSFDGARPSIHQRLDELEVKLEHMINEQRANAEALEAILERVRRLTPPQ
ncbi:MAG: hypothetical protein M3Z33_04995 [Actinomycetota bacterium]|nr:hypothetical protein [Actinomycetota bacterium]